MKKHIADPLKPGRCHCGVPARTENTIPAEEALRLVEDGDEASRSLVGYICKNCLTTEIAMARLRGPAKKEAGS